MKFAGRVGPDDGTRIVSGRYEATDRRGNGRSLLRRKSQRRHQGGKEAQLEHYFVGSNRSNFRLGLGPKCAVRGG